MYLELIPVVEEKSKPIKEKQCEKGVKILDCVERLVFRC